MPGHRAPATGRSPSTGQMGEKETSSLPITGHRPSSLRSLELDRLNSREIQESPSTGHARSPSNRPPGTGQQNITQNIASDSHTFGVEFTSKQQSTPRLLLPMEPGFSNMPNPSVVITGGWTTSDNIRHLSLVGDPAGISLKKEIDIRRGRDEDRPLHHPSYPIHLLTLQRESLGDQNIPIKREEGDIHPSSSSSVSHSRIRDYGRYQRNRYSP